MRFLICCVLSVFTTSSVRADIMMSTTSGLSFVENSGSQSFQLFGLSTPTDPTITSLIATVTINSGTLGLGNFSSPISFSSNFNPSNLNPASSGSLDAVDPRIAYMSLDFNAPQLIPNSSPGVLGTFAFNVNGLLPGLYGIRLSDLATDGVAITGINGQFEIVTIPELSTFLATGLGLGFVFYRRRRA